MNQLAFVVIFFPSIAFCVREHLQHEGRVHD